MAEKMENIGAYGFLATKTLLCLLYIHMYSYHMFYGCILTKNHLHLRTYVRMYVAMHLTNGNL